MKSPVQRLIDHFGSQQATASALGVKQGTVSGWFRGIHGVSAEVAIRAETLTQGEVKAIELRPTLAASAA
ncbi:transcriptional regulator [Pseudomonas cremoricolorata]|uniref:Regulatory protein n=1 Tax=Pseudomonas cremoricolorata TaxID=157783 RepID=A0A089WNR8_9PSED|nr:Cro/CI family transcriptional regulator [Pseudomonas cremoricolorata]AIR90206.1 regulatory protein [Pseudomonas cremoricolorata]